MSADMTASSPPATRRSSPTGDPADLPDRLRRVPGSAAQPLTVLLGLAGSALLAAAAVGAGGVLVRDPLLADGPLSWIRYGHGRDMAMAAIYAGFALIVWAWVRLGRAVLAGAAGRREVLTAAAVWLVPMLVSPPLFTRDVYSYLGQGALALEGMDPYQVGPVELSPGPLPDNVHYFWQTTPAPYGPFFLLIAKLVHAATTDELILGVIGMRLVLLTGLAMLIYSVPRLAHWLGGQPTVALWLVVANPMTVVHLVGGPHNDLLMIGLLTTGTLLVLRGRAAAGIALVTVAAGVKATALMALPFLVWMWAAQLPGGPWPRFGKAVTAGLSIFTAVFAAIMLVSGLNLGWLAALHAPSLNINWMSLPTGVGLLVHGVVQLAGDIDDRQPILDVTRMLGAVVLAVFATRQWWAARHGGPDAVRRAAIVLLATALLSPITLPWYLTWALALAAGLAWSEKALTWVVGASTWLVLASYPDGETALDSFLYVAATALASALAAASLLRPDPLRLSRHRRPGPAPPRQHELSPVGAEGGE